MAIVNKAKESFLNRKKWNGNEVGSWCSYIPTASSMNMKDNKKNTLNTEDEHEQGSQRTTMSASLPKSFQQSCTSSSSYSRSSTSTPISIAESTDKNEDTIYSSISSAKEYYDERTW